jgi:heme exporter protein A
MNLHVQNLSCARGGIAVLSGVTFALSPGQALLLRGPNGVGKTTLLRCIAGLQPPTGGRIVLPEAGVVYAAHADGVKAMLTVAENLRFWAAVQGAAGGVEAAMRAMDLLGLADRPAQNLSAGQRRRLGLARLLLGGRGALWLMDEPTVSLDSASVGLVERAVAAHLAGGGMALIATHQEMQVPGAGVLDLTAFPPPARAADAFAGPVE